MSTIISELQKSGITIIKYQDGSISIKQSNVSFPGHSYVTLTKADIARLHEFAFDPSLQSNIHSNEVRKAR